MPVLTAGQAVLGVVGTRTFKLRLTAAGKRLRKRVKRTRLTAEGTFTRFGERLSARNTTFVLRRKQLIGSALARCWTARADRLTRAGQQAAPALSLSQTGAGASSSARISSRLDGATPVARNE